MKDRLYLNTHNPNAAAVAKKVGFGIELDDYAEAGLGVHLDDSPVQHLGDRRGGRGGPRCSRRSGWCE